MGCRTGAVALRRFVGRKSRDQSRNAAGIGGFVGSSECGTEMAIIRVTPILFGGEFEDLTLACKKCGYTKELRIKRT